MVKLASEEKRYTQTEVAQILEVSLSSVKNYIDKLEADDLIHFNEDRQPNKKGLLILRKVALSKNRNLQRVYELKDIIEELECKNKELEEEIKVLKNRYALDLQKMANDMVVLQREANVLMAQLNQRMEAIEASKKEISSSSNERFRLFDWLFRKKA